MIETLRSMIGDIDPASASLAFIGIVLAAIGLEVARRALRWQQTVPPDVAERLAVAIGQAERGARQQLLGGHDRVIDVQFDLQPAPTHNAAGAISQGRLREIAAYYQRLRPRRLVITGASGAGKTVLAIELILSLIESRGKDDPVPVRLPATILNLDFKDDVDPMAATQQMERWLVDHLVRTYRLNRKSAWALVKAGLVLPVIDGLDELDATDTPGYASRAGHVLRVFNGYQRLRSKAELIVTCSSRQYSALIADYAWLEDAARVEIRPVSAAMARAFIVARAVDADRWNAVLDGMKRNRRGRLALALDTPWRLTLALTVYEERDSDGKFLRNPGALNGPATDTPEAIRDHLLGLFIPAAFRPYATRQPYESAQAQAWLAVLASYLDRNAATGRQVGGRVLSGTDIVLQELWPLAGFRRPRMVHTVIALLAAVLVTVPIVIAETVSRVPGVLTAIVACFAAVMAYAAWSTWPQPHRLVFGGRRTLKSDFRAVLNYGSWAGLAGAWMVKNRTGAALQILTGIACFIMMGSVGFITSGQTTSRDIGTPRPESIIRNDFVFGITFGMMVGLTFGLIFGVYRGMAVGLTYGIFLSLTTIFIFCAAGPRYVALLLCTRWPSRNSLPWRLGRFLAVCHQAGLIRIAGRGYQFRHRELQDYLARHATSWSSRSSPEPETPPCGDR
ncbi:NACHT domain-containing protein [Micromonospora sp. HUAS LYJ1]|uniref:NACHT domain-containing protein n=1 Tax=Micromonospora sp. HUAS LYJ1 TaxID=3061626 RepID=UPI0026731929|nr:NACHT domain-containing protein [Micromonospora sp. HUAS LYJ1]WKU08684.1 NACHT domain-containing protein [Micromonospora sp. HUAS LYJ1]